MLDKSFGGGTKGNRGHTNEKFCAALSGYECRYNNEWYLLCQIFNKNHNYMLFSLIAILVQKKEKTIKSQNFEIKIEYRNN
jgi:hypothetical protein